MLGITRLGALVLGSVGCDSVVSPGPSGAIVQLDLPEVAVRPSAPFRLGLATAILSLVACSADADPAPDGRELVWSDEFDGAAGALPDPASWTAETGASGWGNDELQCYTDAPGNASTDGDGHLVIAARHEPGHVCSDGRGADHTSARITTFGTVTPTLGRLEVRAQVPAGVGTWAAFWALGQDIQAVGWPAAGEIDVLEHLGRRPTEVLGSAHWEAEPYGHRYLTRTDTAGEDLSDSFHVYAVEWTADALTFSLDGRDYGSVTRAQVEAEGPWPFDRPFYLLLNLAVGGRLGGDVPASTTFPQRFVVDYVRVYADAG